MVKVSTCSSAEAALRPTTRSMIIVRVASHSLLRRRADSVNLYVDNTDHSTVTRNLIYDTPNPAFLRPDINAYDAVALKSALKSCSYATGIQIANEGYPFPLNPLNSITITYTYIHMHCARCFAAKR